MKQRKDELPAWDELLSAGARLQKIVLVGGTAAAIVARHRFSFDADHVVTDLKVRFDRVLADLEQVAGWTTARIRRPVLILGSLDGIETGIRQFIRTEPLETQQIPSAGSGSTLVVVPTPAEILRIKAALVLKRNATRDYVDLAALSRHLGPELATSALIQFDALYPQPNGQSATQQLLVQMVDARPYDLDATRLESYKGLEQQWHSWASIQDQLRDFATSLFRRHLDQSPDVGKMPIAESGLPEHGSLETRPASDVPTDSAAPSADADGPAAKPAHAPDPSLGPGEPTEGSLFPLTVTRAELVAALTMMNSSREAPVGTPDGDRDAGDGGEGGEGGEGDRETIMAHALALARIGLHHSLYDNKHNKDTPGTTVFGTEAAEALLKGFGRGHYRRLWVDPDKTTAADGSEMTGMAAVLTKARALSAQREAARLGAAGQKVKEQKMRRRGSTFEPSGPGSR